MLALLGIDDEPALSLLQEGASQEAGATNLNPKAHMPWF